MIGLTCNKPKKDFYYYKKALQAAGAEVVYLSYDLPEVDLNKLYGLVLSGGIDIHPSIYAPRSPLHSTVKKTNIKRDRFELEMLEKFLKIKKPVLGICRGIQVLNCFFGGSLYQDIDAQFPPKNKEKKHKQDAPEYNISKDKLTHSIIIKKKSWLYDIFKKDVMLVNSTHHQAIKKLGGGLSITSYSPDGIVEAVEAGGSVFIKGVQFHPERLINKHPEFLEIFKEFLKECKRRQYDKGNSRSH